ncbi:sarcosine oxidase subunit gamma [Lentilitoribacter sp. EG35]|uniref:sarcosine oxidase subunit gamma n=1 Tax=Lentilitoribacter sp. EG35 TaxID=3234192 RepID=UPI0034609C2E
MSELKPAHSLGDIKTLGIKGTTASVNIAVRPVSALVQLFAKKSNEKQLMKKVGFATQSGSADIKGDFTALPVAPNQWILSSQSKSGPKFGDELSDQVQGIGYVSEQSDSRVCFRITGLDARTLLSRGCRLDLHPSVTGAGFCAQTQMAGCGVLLHQVTDEPVYDLYVYSGFARFFWNWLSQCAKQFNK